MVFVCNILPLNLILPLLRRIDESYFRFTIKYNKYIEEI